MPINSFILLGSSELCRMLNLCPFGRPMTVNLPKPDIFRTSTPIKQWCSETRNIPGPVHMDEHVRPEYSGSRTIRVLSGMILYKDRRRPAKRCQLTGYVSVFHWKSLNFLRLIRALNLCFAQKLLEVARTAKSCHRRKKWQSSCHA